MPIPKVRIIAEGPSARDLSLEINGQKLPGVLRFSLEADANGTGAGRFALLKIEMLADVQGPLDLLALIEVQFKTLDDLRGRTGARRAAEGDPPPRDPDDIDADIIDAEFTVIEREDHLETDGWPALGAGATEEGEGDDDPR